MNNEYVNSMARRLEQDYGWNHNCAHTFATFLSETNENNTNGTPEIYPLWCEFLIAAQKLPRNQRPDDVDIIVVLEEVVGWAHEGDSIKHLKTEYSRGLMLLDYYQSITVR